MVEGARAQADFSSSRMAESSRPSRELLLVLEGTATGAHSSGGSPLK
jgi:hypothetical protein